MDWRDDKGLAWIPILIVVGVIIIIFIILKGVFGSEKQIVSVSGAVCDCPDAFAMANRLAEVKALIASAQATQQTQAAADATAGKATMYTGDLYNQGKAANQAAVDAANKGGRTGAGKTETDCTTHILDPASTCMEAALQTHENVHAAACLAYKKGRTNPIWNSGPSDWKEAETLVDYWNEDITAYQAEEAFLTANLNRVMNDPKCKKKVTLETYPGKESKEQQQQRLAGSKRRLGNYARVIG